MSCRITVLVLGQKWGSCDGEAALSYTCKYTDRQTIHKITYQIKVQHNIIQVLFYRLHKLYRYAWLLRQPYVYSRKVFISEIQSISFHRYVYRWKGRCGIPKIYTVFCACHSNWILVILLKTEHFNANTFSVFKYCRQPRTIVARYIFCNSHIKWTNNEGVCHWLSVLQKEVLAQLNFLYSMKLLEKSFLCVSLHNGPPMWMHGPSMWMDMKNPLEIPALLFFTYIVFITNNLKYQANACSFHTLASVSKV